MWLCLAYTKPTPPDHGAQHLAQQFAIQCHGHGARLVRLSSAVTDNPRSILDCNLSYLIIARAKPVPELQRPDIVIAADCVYFEPAFPPLVSTLAVLVPPPPERAPEVLFCYKKRRKADKRFFSLLKKYFTWNIVRGRELRICSIRVH